jgi:hypothetical protein
MSCTANDDRLRTSTQVLIACPTQTRQHKIDPGDKFRNTFDSPIKPEVFVDGKKVIVLELIDKTESSCTDVLWTYEIEMEELQTPELSGKATV